MSSEQDNVLPPSDPKADDVSTVSTGEPDTPCNSSVAESLAQAPTKNNTVVFRNVVHTGSNVDPSMAGLIQQTRELSELVFDENCLTSVTKKSGWKLSLLATTDLSILCGFAVTKMINGALSIAKIAVPVEFRGLGFGKLLMEDAIKHARKQGDVFEVCLSSLSTAVTFYQRIGFKAMTGVKVKTDFEVVEGQVYMVKKLRPRPKGK
jgi:ribosomal protein S18 acetylase RimI-like enzyme